MASLHTIQRHFLHVELNGTEAQAFALQNQLSQFCTDWLFPALEQVFDSLIPDNEIYCIDRLDIDVGTIRSDRLQHELAGAVADAIEKRLQGHIASKFEQKAANDVNVQSKTSQQSNDEAFAYFLDTGRLPWSYPLPKGKSLESHLLDTWGKNNQASTYFKDNLRHALKSAVVRNRLVSQFSAKFLQTLLGLVDPDWHKATQSVLAIVNDNDITPHDVNAFTRQLWETAYRSFADDALLTGRQLIEEVCATLPSGWQNPDKLKRALDCQVPTLAKTSGNGESGLTETPIKSDLLRSIMSILDDSGISDKAIGYFRQLLLKAFSELPAGQKITEAHIVSRAWRDVTAAAIKAELEKLLKTHWPAALALDVDAINVYAKANNTLDTVPVPANKESHLTQAASADLQEGIYIENAGLVLLHPFLPQFFSALNIVVDDVVVHPERALCLLHFLATGQSVAPEYELVLPKVLCNIPVEQPVAMDVDLTELELDEADGLLEAVIRHWDVLKNTSIDGLRNTFLLRSGKLSQRVDGDWQLQVENKAFDILMGQLPWGVGLVKLPWMQRMLWVEWG